ncbi:MAG: acylphosphatase [Deltaproteobacteria bacterium]|nr:acylphosphatase [Deltaproteobacteria bacterium]
MAARWLLISGQVQGVGYRAWVERSARSLGLRGWVRNLADGRVEAFFEGETSAVETMCLWCKGGPSLARVSGVDAEDRPEAGHSGFEIRPSGLGPKG